MSDTTDDSRGPDGDPLRDPTAPDWAAPMSSGDEPAEASDAPVPSQEPEARTEPAQPTPTAPPIDATQSIDPSATAALPIPPPAPQAPPAPIANPYGAPPANPYAGPPANPYATPQTGGQGSPPPPTAPQGYPYGGPPQAPPPPPANPYAAYPQQGGNPYATGPSGQPGHPQPGYPQPGYAVPGGQPPFAYRQAQQGGTNVSAVVLLILSGLALLPCCIIEIPAVILAIVALTKQNDDPEGSKRITKYGWIAFAVGAVIAVIVWVVIFTAGIMSGSTSSDGYSY